MYQTALCAGTSFLQVSGAREKSTNVILDDLLKHFGPCTQSVMERKK